MSESTSANVAQAVAGANWRRAGGFAGAAIGVLAAGAAAGVAVERLTVGRGMRKKARLALDASGPYGSLRGMPGRAAADDGTGIYYEVDEVDAYPPGQLSGVRASGADGEPGRPGAAGTAGASGAAGAPGAAGTGRAAGARKRRLSGRRAAEPVTVVFSHGYCLSQDSWHFQRAALRGVVRTVHWDQRSHGRSERGRAQADGVPLTIDQLGRDLKAVIDAAAPEGPLVLVGHSMGGMTMMAFGDQFPELVRDRVVGAAFVGTSCGKLGEVSFGLPVAGVNAVRRVLPGVLKALGSQTELVERGRRATADLFAGLIKRYSFGSKDVDPGVARFAERLIEGTAIDVVAEFYPAFTDHDKADALAEVFAEVPALVLAGENDLVTPSAHSQIIADLLPAAELVIVPDAGHLVMLEHPETVTGRLTELLARAGAVPADANVGLYGSPAQPGS
ncbi:MULTISPECIES: alpha/beta fold hydrolase [unclassified Streptomyces]|uniref:alpha/beta fold hydrolase n=1 Tax=unclassified Streptomyces TaxID=2593676 RepID=UPI002E1C775F|nr:alpha/beta hydrolase [Streptomyces sp. NBC_01023]